MLFFISPVSSLVQNFSEEKALLRAYLGLTESMSEPITNSVGEFQFYYRRFLGYLIHNLDNTIAEIEAADKYVEEQETPTTPQATGYTPEETDARDSLFGSVSQQPAPAPYTPEPTPTPEEKIESPYSDKEEIAKVELAFNKIINTDPTEKVQGQEQPLQADEVPVTETTETEQIFDELKSESFKERMLGAKNKSELDKIKAENPDKATEIWDSLSIPEKNYIKCLLKSQNTHKTPATLGFKFTYTAPLTKIKHDALYLGYYLHGEQVPEDKRAILVEGEAIVCGKNDLKPFPTKKQPALTPEVKAELESIITNPEPTEPDTAPTAEEISANTFTGLAPAPKRTTGIVTGNKPDSEVSKPNDVVESGDLIRVTTKDSIAHGKSVEVDYVKPDGTVKAVWDNKAIYIPKSGYELEIKNLKNLSPKA
ncbi:MAG: hypothetical protein QNJ68_08025 [Microcoleaceae cyanobacterium MO_207.B10]|nr:hypothetical protein [Microcoleaceae cyanobacterium MO_207.B10]